MSGGYRNTPTSTRPGVRAGRPGSRAGVLLSTRSWRSLLNGRSLDGRMPLLPYLRYEAISPKTPSEVLAALRDVIEPRRLLGLVTGTRPFEGEVEDGTFNFRPIIRRRGNLFLPRIRGTIDANPEGSRIGITMRPSLLVLVFAATWLGYVAVLCGAMLVSSLRGRGSAYGALGAAIMFILGWAVVAGIFTFETRKASRQLADVLMTADDAVEGICMPPQGLKSRPANYSCDEGGGRSGLDDGDSSGLRR